MNPYHAKVELTYPHVGPVGLSKVPVEVRTIHQATLPDLNAISEEDSDVEIGLILVNDRGVVPHGKLGAQRLGQIRDRGMVIHFGQHQEIR